MIDNNSIICKSRLRAKLILFTMVMAGLVAGCTSIALYSEVAYQQAVSLKVESLALMDKASEDFSAHKAEVADLKLKLSKAWEYAKGRADNELSAKQWEILIDPEGHLMGGFLKRWEQDGTLSPAFAQEAKGLVSDAFDTIIGLESGKIKPGEIHKR